MSAGPRRLQPTDLDLRIKSGAAFTCDLSTRVGATGVAGEPEARRVPGFVDLASDRTAVYAWLRGIVYLGFAVAIVLPWVLLLADQLSG